MKPLAIAFALLLTCFSLSAQKSKSIKVPLVAEKWTFEPQKVVFLQENGIQTMKILPHMGKVILKDLDFSSGTIEFDIKPLAPAFTSFYFRMKDANENECFYFRTARADKPMAMDAVQYAPFISGVNLWDMLGEYQTNASFKREEWNHVKLVISGVQMRVYVNSPSLPTLEVPRLEGNTSDGTIAFEGEAIISNLVIKPGEVEGLASWPGTDPTHHDPRYIRSWAVSQPITTPKNTDYSADFLPTPETTWEVVEAERRGLVNLTRKFGKSDARRFVWLKAKIHAASAQKKRIDFGFSDEVWVFLNGKMVYIDKNLYGQPVMKEPDGRCSVENTSFVLPLNKGHNELLIGLANDFYGWGIIARMENMEDIEIAPDPTFDARMVKVSESILNTYAGKYLQPDGRNVLIERENNALKVSGEGFPTAILYPESENRFFIKEFDLQMEFQKDAANKVTNFIIYNSGKQVLDVKRAN